MKISEKTFFEILSTLKHQRWRITKEGELRNRYGCCPFVAVARQYGVKCDNIDAVEAEEELNKKMIEINNDLFMNIIAASDGDQGFSFLNRFRKKMMSALGMIK